LHGRQAATEGRCARLRKSATLLLFNMMYVTSTACDVQRERNGQTE
jgi:hypothetical protein